MSHTGRCPPRTVGSGSGWRHRPGSRRVARGRRPRASGSPPPCRRRAVLVADQHAASGRPDRAHAVAQLLPILGFVPGAHCAGPQGLSYDYVPVHLGRNEHFAEPFASDANSRLVPALKLDDGRWLTQSMAIIEYPRRNSPRAAFAAAPLCTGPGARWRRTSPARSTRSTTCACCAI